jgi:hypothetical protein
MEKAIPIVIAVVLLLLPFFYLAKAIFFFRENRTLKYRSINIRALIYTLVAIVIIGFYFSIPTMLFKMETATKNAPAGAYAGIGRNDTIMLNGFQMKHRYDNPMINYSSPYILSSTMSEKDIWGKLRNGFAHYLLGRKLDIENEIFTLTYPVRDANDNVQPNKKNKKVQPNPTQNTYITNRYYLSLKSDTLILIPFNGPAIEMRYLRFANYY